MGRAWRSHPPIVYRCVVFCFGDGGVFKFLLRRFFSFSLPVVSRCKGHGGGTGVRGRGGCSNGAQIVRPLDSSHRVGDRTERRLDMAVDATAVVP